ncbi:MG2 domain-containing protein [Campylobacter jejuni]|nr:MG2 domain-containing protein [Campylobacter jejuni]
MFKKILMSCFMLLFLFACSDNKSFSNKKPPLEQGVRAKSDGLIKHSEAIFVEFDKAIVDFDEMIIDGKINSKDEKISLLKTSDSSFLLNFNSLEANKDYKIEFNYKDIPIVLNFKTDFIENFTYKSEFEGDDEKIYLDFVYDFGFKHSNWDFEDKTQEGLKITLDGKELPFKKLDKFHLITDNIKLLDKTRELVLTYDEKIMGFKESKIFKFQVPSKQSNSDFRLISAEKKEQIITLKFSKDLDENQNFKEFIRIFPDINFKAYSVGKELKISANFALGKTYDIAISKGLKSVQGLVNNGEKTSIAFEKDLEPSLSFASNGVFLANKADHKIYIKSRNIKKVSVEVSQIFSNNLGEYLRYKELSGLKQDNSRQIWESPDSFYYIGKQVLSKTIDIQSQKNTWVNTEIDLKELKKLSGVFAINVYVKDGEFDYEFNQNDDKYYEIREKTNIKKNIIFSSIALSAQKLNNELIIHARDFGSNESLSGVKIELIDRRNQNIKTMDTNFGGDAKFTLNDSNEILYILASKGDNASILKLNSPLSTDGYEVGGLQEDGAIKAFVYTDRGVYRPGDSIHLSVVARSDKKPIKHPIYLTFYNPKGQKIISEKAIKNTNDIFYEKINTDKNDINGIYTAEFKIAGTYFTKDILLQSVVPNRIKVTLNADENTTKDRLAYALSADYLFGTVASNLKYQNKIYFSPKIYSNPKYKNYIFKNPTSRYAMDLSSENEGVLDENGRANIKTSLPKELQSAQGLNYNARIVSEVFENGGRAVGSVKDVNINYYDYFVGLKALDNDYVSSGSKIEFWVIASDLGHNLLSNKKIKYKIYHNKYSWWWDYDNYNEFLRSIKQDKSTQIVASGELVTQKDPVKIEFDAADYYGEMFIEIIDEESGVSAGQNFYVSAWGEPSRVDVVSNLKIKSDKTNYKVGENAKIEFESTKNAKALITLSNNSKILERFIVDTKDQSTSVEFNMKKEYTPNVYVSVSLFQDYESLDNDRALRLFGVVPLNVIDEDTKLDLEVKTPEKILPNSEFEVQIQSKNHKAYNYTIAIVDEGLLDLTDFKTPDIWGYFYAKRGFSLKTYDTYNQIIPKFTGGDMLASNRAQKNRDDNAQRFKPVVFFNAPAKSDDKGFASLKFKMPSYMGSVRVMVVANSNNSFSSAQKTIQVSAPVVMLETLPRTLKVGDDFTILAELFKTQKEINEASLSVKSKNKLIHLPQSNFKVNFDAKTQQEIAIEANVSKDSVGMDILDFELKTKDYSFKNSIEIDIKPINPYTYESQKFLVRAGESKEFSIDKSYLKGTSTALLKISPTPIINLDKRLKYLINYPYGCIEQTTSAVLPQLFIDKFSTNFDKQKAINNINAAIERYVNFQTADGGFAYWQGDEKSSLWGSNYAGMFLILAKENGYFVPDSMYERWLKYEQNFVQNSANANYVMDIKANSLYLLAMAKRPNISEMNLLYDNLNVLSTEAKWQLAAAYKLAGVEDIAKKIASQISTTPDSKYSYYTYGSVLRDRAIIANAYRQIYGKNNEELLQKISDTLESKDYLSTQSTGYALYALALGINLGNASENFMDANLKLNEENHILNQNQIQIFSFKDKKAVLNAKKDTFVSFGIEGVRMDENTPFSNKIILERTFYDEKGGEISPSQIKSGQTFYMRISASLSQEAGFVSNVALTQILPSGWEVSNTILDDNAPSFFKNSPLDFIDVRDDKIMWFFSLNKNQTRAFFVKLNAVTPGAYTLSGAYAEAMYDDTYKALSQSEKVFVIK